MSAEILNEQLVFQGQNRRQARGEPEVRVRTYRGPLSSLWQVLADFGGQVMDYSLEDETGPMPKMAITLNPVTSSEGDQQSLQESTWELVSYGMDIPLRRADYFKGATGLAKEEILSIDAFLDMGARQRWGDELALLGDTGITALAQKYRQFRLEQGHDTVEATRWMIRQTILAARTSQLKPSMSGIDQIDSAPPVPSTAQFAVDQIGGVWVKRAPQVMSAGRQRFRIVQQWENGRTEDYPTELYGSGS